MAKSSFHIFRCIVALRNLTMRILSFFIEIFFFCQFMHKINILFYYILSSFLFLIFWKAIFVLFYMFAVSVRVICWDGEVMHTGCDWRGCAAALCFCYSGCFSPWSVCKITLVSTCMASHSLVTFCSLNSSIFWKKKEFFSALHMTFISRFYPLHIFYCFQKHQRGKIQMFYRAAVIWHCSALNWSWDTVDKLIWARQALFEPVTKWLCLNFILLCVFYSLYSSKQNHIINFINHERNTFLLEKI